MQTATAVQMQDAVIRRMEALRVLAMLDILEMELHVQVSSYALKFIISINSAIWKFLVFCVCKKIYKKSI